MTGREKFQLVISYNKIIKTGQPGITASICAQGRTMKVYPASIMPPTPPTAISRKINTTPIFCQFIARPVFSREGEV
ncbi:hypothetical protein ACZ87_03062 [Candidatus Erwinia dacicola]|uniref:Uncharacterized protein n=1 Tax=Candidatus Erwinia dacicola TaxID=252393 RepID=A0A328TJA1_9GAMM|nr:hypothetical protein ACZ87_03062 [Candidatus Erwinia dacicola]